MTGAGADVQVLARIDATRFYARPESYREEVRAWLRANGIDPWDVTRERDVEVVLLDAPAIVYEHKTLGVVHKLLWVELPEHLADPA